MKKHKTPLRKCVACSEHKDKRELIRLVKNKEGQVFFDPTGKANGRGAYICRSLECFEKAIKDKSLQRSLKTSLDQETIDELRRSLEN
ncbi:MAG: YlxR family protein [Tissierellia bacterium]|nr:YlxR family protein [Tissierellia bacterium]